MKLTTLVWIVIQTIIAVAIAHVIHNELATGTLLYIAGVANLFTVAAALYKKEHSQ